MLIASTSDIHSPKYLTQFFMAYNSVRNVKIDLFLLAGDLVNEGEYNHFYPIYDVLKKYTTVAVFGNEDFTEKREYYRKYFDKIIWLEDEVVKLDIKGKKVTIVGSEGVLEEPTKWQKLNGLDEEFYRNRKEKIFKMLCEEGDLKILLTHYASSFSTVVGERKNAYPQLGDRIIEEAECLPHVAIHGHAHYAKITFSIVRNVRVYNVALPANKKIVLIQTF
ncbi:metallophosphoesterase [Sulfolobus sp. S-194]|uniref:metallophosphoesterase family protein n=1 Tax=Sulfolobus sp. S-194 TaxID=2512240 RepID=UPI00143700AF|nr:metallophosphoesterase [Sulfolobus sp. S-194]QIW23449.1 metallophosphoesterase [Sulfolobus sp. S-194]